MKWLFKVLVSVFVRSLLKAPGKTPSKKKERTKDSKMVQTVSFSMKIFKKGKSSQHEGKSYQRSKKQKNRRTPCIQHEFSMTCVEQSLSTKKQEDQEI